MRDDKGYPLPPETHSDCIRAGYGEPLFPCPWVSCRHHLAVYEDREGRFQIEPVAIGKDGEVNLLLMERTCSLRAAKEGERSHEEIARMLGITREGVRLIAIRAIEKLRTEMDNETYEQEPAAPLELPRDRHGRHIGDEEELA